MSHELRTPLNAILGFSQLMARDSSLGKEHQENLETISRSGEHLLVLINDILEMSKIEAGRTTLVEQSFDLGRLLDDLEDMFGLRASNKGLQLIFDRALDVPRYVQTDEGKLRQVLINLLGNAVKFTADGGVTLRVATKDEGRRTKEQPSSVVRPSSFVFEVEDTGPGMSPEDLEKVFDPFVQTESGQASQEGTGLGLPISREFVRLMGGELTAKSELGQGSLFKFDIQIELAEASGVQPEQPTRRVVRLEPDQPVYRLLVVDDRDTSRELLVKLLTPLGFDVQTAVNGQEAVEVSGRWEPHLIWMDMRMPVMDGYEATQRIKATTKGQSTVIVALTASAFEEDHEMVLSAGCDDFVRKPFREHEIFDALAHHLGVRFVYDEEGAQPTSAQAAETEDVLSSQTMATMPVDWLARLHQAAIQADADLALELTEQIRAQHGSLADALASLINNFRFDTLMELTQPS
jgi:two-component system sensor histidine kinase/response regulator